MKRNTNTEQIQTYIDKLGLSQNFSTKDLQFEIYSYDKGEQMVSPLSPLTHFLFVISGSIRIYQLNEDSTFNVVINLGPGRILGYHEFCFGSDEYTLYAEALGPVTCLVLPFSQRARRLKDDNDFLMYLLKTTLINELPSDRQLPLQSSLEEQVVFYLLNLCENQTMTSVNTAVDVLHCSRRSLQRVLKKMCDEKLLIHSKKGVYQLAQEQF